MSADPGGIEFGTCDWCFRRTRKSREFDGQPQERIFRGHAAYTIGLGAEGQVLAVGPVTDSKAEQEPVRGFGGYPQGSHERHDNSWQMTPALCRDSTHSAT